VAIVTTGPCYTRGDSLLEFFHIEQNLIFHKIQFGLLFTNRRKRPSGG
jgi:hypothetical protein